MMSLINIDFSLNFQPGRVATLVESKEVSWNTKRKQIKYIANKNNKKVILVVWASLC